MTWSPNGHNVLAIRNSPTTFGGWSWKDPKQPPITLGLADANSNLVTAAWCPAPTSQYIAAGSQDGSVYIWNANHNGLPALQLSSDRIQGSVLALAWSADGQWLAASYNDTDASILVWKIQGGS